MSENQEQFHTYKGGIDPSPEVRIEKRLAVPMQDIDALTLKEGDHLSLMVGMGNRLIELDITSIEEGDELIIFRGKDAIQGGDETSVTFNKLTNEFREA